MAFFIELHRKRLDELIPIFINVETISYIEPYADNDCIINTTRISNDGEGERIQVSESYAIVKMKLKDYE